MCERCHKAGGDVKTILGWLCSACDTNSQDEQRFEFERRRRAKIEHYQRLSEMGSRFVDRRFDNYRVSSVNSQAFLAAKRACEDSSGLYLYGPPGNGKTHLAAAIVNECVERLVPAIFTTSVGLVLRIRETYTPKGSVREGERDILDRYATADVMVLDDLGTEQFTPNTARMFYALVNQRYEDNLPLVVTSNVSLADLALQWADGSVESHIATKICDRMREMCGTVVRINAPSERGAA